MAEAREAQNVSTTNGSGTVIVTERKLSDNEKSPSVRLKLEKKPNTDKKVKWDEGAVDNEFMNKKKSKCCCIYEKPKVFGESSSESDDDDDCEHCRGHKRKCYKKEHDNAHENGGLDNQHSSQPDSDATPGNV